MKSNTISKDFENFKKKSTTNNERLKDRITDLEAESELATISLD
jgi:hypothetical protein